MNRKRKQVFRRLSAFGRMPVVCIPVLLLTASPGCTVMENVRKNLNQPFEDMESKVQARKTQLAELEDEGSRAVPMEMGAANVIVREMEYFSGRKEHEQVNRLDGSLEPIMASIRAAVSDVSPPGDEAIADETAKLRSETGTLRDDLKKVKAELDESRRTNEALREDIRNNRHASDLEIRSLTQRIEIVKAARDEAVKEVVRTRSRIQGMASSAEAAAMFAEARVIIDRMEEEAFSDQAEDYLRMAGSYLDSGKKELEDDNPGGAAYLFDLISTLYEAFRGSEPRKVTVASRSVILRKSPSSSAPAVGRFSQGVSVEGIERKSGWFLVRDRSGTEGWLERNSVH